MELGSGVLAWDAHAAGCVCVGHSSDKGLSIQAYPRDDEGIVGLIVYDGEAVVARYGWLPAKALDEA